MAFNSTQSGSSKKKKQNAVRSNCQVLRLEHAADQWLKTDLKRKGDREKGVAARKDRYKVIRDEIEK